MSQVAAAEGLIELLVACFVIPIRLAYGLLKAIVTFIVRQISPAPPLDAAMLAVVERLTGLIYHDQAAYSAARQAAWDHGDYHFHPIKCLDGVSFLAGNEPPHVRKRLEEEANQRFEAAIPRRAWEGATAYVLGRRGNAYARFLYERFGTYSAPAQELSSEEPAQGAHPIPWHGSGQGDRFGPKQFLVLFAGGTSAREALGRVAKALGQFVSPFDNSRAWRVIPGVSESPVVSGALSFRADGAYVSDGRPHVSRQGEGLIVRAEPVSGRGNGGRGTVHLTCSAVEDSSDEHVLLIFEFSEAAYPMWTNREAEALVACTIAALSGLLAQEVLPDSRWEFGCGGWVHSQLVRTSAQESVELIQG